MESVRSRMSAPFPTSLMLAAHSSTGYVPLLLRMIIPHLRMILRWSAAVLSGGTLARCLLKQSRGALQTRQTQVGRESPTEVVHPHQTVRRVHFDVFAQFESTLVNNVYRSQDRD